MGMTRFPSITNPCRPAVWEETGVCIEGDPCAGTSLAEDSMGLTEIIGALCVSSGENTRDGQLRFEKQAWFSLASGDEIVQSACLVRRRSPRFVSGGKESVD